MTEKIEYEAKRKDGRELYSTLFTALDKLSVTEKDDYSIERNILKNKIHKYQDSDNCKRLVEMLDM